MEKLRILIIWMLLFVSEVSAAQSEVFSKLLALHSDDTLLITRLKQFADQGLELPLVMGQVSPKQFIDTAMTYIGTPHCMGGVNHRCIDCSGLLYITFKSFGVHVPHSSEGIAHYGKLVIEPDSLCPGDLIFFVGTYNTRNLITHAGIYVDQGKFIHTSKSRGVIISNLKDKYYWNKHFIFGKRIFY